MQTTSGLRHVEVKLDRETVHITMNNPTRRNALSSQALSDLQEAFDSAARTDASGIILAANGPVFSAGHDFADVADRDVIGVRELLQQCTNLMQTIQAIPQIVIAKVQGFATAAGCQLVATCDLAVAARSARFALPGGQGGWFCHTPAVPVARNIGLKRLMELALTGDPIDADTAATWGLINYAVADVEVDEAVDRLLARATRGSRVSKSVGKQTIYAQVGKPQNDAYQLAIEVMAGMSGARDAQEGMSAFLGKRPPIWQHK